MVSPGQCPRSGSFLGAQLERIHWSQLTCSPVWCPLQAPLEGIPCSGGPGGRSLRRSSEEGPMEGFSLTESHGGVQWGVHGSLSPRSGPVEWSV
jgi:hypothetical protein